MDYLKKVQMGIDYIEKNLDFDIKIEEVSSNVGISQWHFQRIFKALTKETLKTYIRSRRFANALDKLMHTDTRIVDIALTSGYETQESFTRAFKTTFSMTPNKYRKIGNNSLFLKKVELTDEYLLHINKNISLVPEIYLQEPMCFVGLRTQFYGPDSEKNNISEKLPPLWANFMERIAEIKNRIPGKCYGIVNQIKSNTDQLEYLAVTAVNEGNNELPKGMVSFKTPLTQYARFTHKGEITNIDNTVDYVYSNFLLNSTYKHTSGPDLEIYDHQYQPISKESIMYYAIPFK